MRHARADYQRFQDPSGKIPADEPVFLIRGQDVVGPKVLRYYACQAHAAGADIEIVSLVLNWAREMETWQAEHSNKTKVADL